MKLKTVSTKEFARNPSKIRLESLEEPVAICGDEGKPENVILSYSKFLELMPEAPEQRLDILLASAETVGIEINFESLRGKSLSRRAEL